MEIRERICKLCLQICGQNFQEIVDNMKYVLEILLLKINFTVVEEPVMCEQCTEMVIKCFDFKAKCLDTHDYMVPFITNKDLNKLDLKDVYVIKNVSCAGVPEDYKVCGFCMSLVNDCSTVSFDVEEEGIRLEEMIKLCLPELDFSLIKKPVSCSPCYESLKNSFYFLVNCLNVEEKIQQYCAPLCTIGKDMVDHRNFILIARDTKDEVDDNPNDLNKVEIQFCQERENLRREIGNQGDADGDIKNKNGSFIEQANVFVYEKYSDTFGTINKEENLCAMEDQACLLHEELQIKADNHEFNSSRGPAMDSASGSTFQWVIESSVVCKPAPVELKMKPKINFQENLLVHEETSDVKIYRCESCTYESKQRKSLARHIKIHRNSRKSMGLRKSLKKFKCEFCSYEAIEGVQLKVHMLIHKNPSEFTVYKCYTCSYETKQKECLQNHMLIHKNPSEIQVFSCEICTYKSKIKRYFNLHMLDHDTSVMTKLKCEICPFETKLKYYLKRHMVVHKTSSELTMFKCDMCTYETKFKRVLKQHKKIHDNPYKCEKCEYQTKHKTTFDLHMMMHQNPSEIKVFKCQICPYEAKRRTDLNNHKNVHSMPMYECEACTYKGKTKRYLNLHMLSHMDPSEITMHKCALCPFQTKHKDYIRLHKLTHKDPSEIKMHKCDLCPFEAKFRQGIRSHRATHLKAMYKCEICPFKTRYKNSLKVHAKIHTTKMTTCE